MKLQSVTVKSKLHCWMPARPCQAEKKQVKLQLLLDEESKHTSCSCGSDSKNTLLCFRYCACTLGQSKLSGSQASK